MEFDPIDEDVRHEIFYKEEDYERFRLEEQKRWERAYARHMIKMEIKKQQSDLEQQILKDEIRDQEM